jgi:hypothetical protein
MLDKYEEREYLRRVRSYLKIRDKDRDKEEE